MTHQRTPTHLDGLYNAPNPTDTALVPRAEAKAPAPSVDLANNPFIHLSNHGAPAKRPRNGKIARLPKTVRDVVNRMLFHNISQDRIVSALRELGITANQQNISNWRTRGGYREWCLAQDQATELRLYQDKLIDLLRRHGASEVPEVGLQAAATQLSQFFLTAEATELLAVNPKEYERRVSMLARISAQVKTLQKYRDDCAKALGSDHNPDRIRAETNTSLDIMTETFTSKIGESAKDPNIPHRNLLPDPAELFHYSNRDPDLSGGPTLLDYLELLHKRVSKPKPNHCDSNENTPSKT